MSDLRYGWFTLLTDCPHCGQPLPLNTPGQESTCASCLQEVQVPTTLWQSVFESFDDGHETALVGQALRGTTSDHGFQLRYEYCLDVPKCEKCGSEFPVDQLESGPARDFACVACGDPASTAAVPDWLQALVPTARRIYSLDPGLAGASAAGASILSPSQESIRPISMSCPQCAGGLQVTTKSKRLMACNFCQAEIYLPDVLWRRLHPVKTVQRFFVGFEGLSRAQKRRADEEELQRQAIARDADLERARQERKARDYEELLRQAEAHGGQGQHLTASAWRVSKLAVGLLAVCVAWVWSADSMFGIHPGQGSGTVVTGLLGAMALIAVVVAMHWVGKPINHVADHGFDWLLFITWFWLPFALVMPVVGSIMALWRGFAMYRGKFMASTIQSNGSTSHYPAVHLENGEGRPGAVLFLALATLWPLLVLGLAGSWF